MTIKAKKSKINLREKLAELLNFRQIRDRLDGLGLYLGKDRTGTTENLAVRGGANVDDLQLAEISAALGGTAVDVFVYDTRNDSDGGKWRERTSHTSWYNEELNTATRGGRREFPAVAVIVAEAGKVTIYDGDDPDLSMWMVFEGTYLGVDIVNILTSDDTHPLSSVFALQGILCIGASALNGFEYINFVDDSAGYYRASISGVYNGGILERNDGKGKTLNSGSFLVDDTVNDVAMNVLPNAPIDAETGLPIPTIAVATDGGVSVIKDDGSVVDIVSDIITTETPFEVNFRGRLLYMLLGSPEGTSNLWNSVSTIYIPDNDVSTTYRFPGDYVAQYFRYNGLPATEPTNSGHDMLVPINSQTHLPLNQRSRAINVLGTDHLYIAGEGSEDKAGGVAAISENLTNPKNGLLAYTTSRYNTGWMPGDIKLATLSDTKIEKVGVDETTELVDNGGFDSDVSGWTKVDPSDTSTLTWNSGAAELERAAGQSGRFYQAIDTIVGARYFIQIGNIDAVNGAGVYVTDGIDTTSWTVIANGGAFIADSNKHYFTATTTSTYIILNTSNESLAVTFDNISVKQTGELITNGTFENNSDWTAYNSPTTSEQSTEQVYAGNYSWKFVTSSASAGISQSYGSYTEAGQKYNLSGYIYSSTGKIWLRWRNGNDSGYIVDNYQLVSGATNTWLPFSLTVKETGSGTEGGIRLVADAAGTFFVDNISIRKVEDDRSVNDNGLQVFGEIDKTPVAPGADLVAYSGFSVDNYLMQSYNPDLDFGTGDFSIITWVNKNSTDTQVILNSGDGSSSRLYIYISGTNELRFAAGGTGTRVYGSIGSDSIWNQITIVRKDGVVYGYINGVLQASYSNSDAVTHSSNDTLKIGLGSSGLYPFGGSLSLIRFTATSITPDQVAKIYRDEKQLFTDGAQATLYGTSDAVTALAYDDKTELLHVGTSGGRSDFSGLRRINNTTTAVTTSISASNNLIAEQ